jgi:hypothetical protein
MLDTIYNDQSPEKKKAEDLDSHLIPVKPKKSFFGDMDNLEKEKTP